MNKKSSFVSNLMWKFGERILAQSITFVVSIVLARLLSPSDYGIIAIVLVFIDIANVFVTTGFGESLLVKKDADNLDCSTIFWSSLLIACILYFAIFFSSPIIARYYDNDQLITVLRVIAIILPISSLNTVQNAIVSKRMEFKRFFFSTSMGALFSGIVSIILAFNGYGIWALVFQYLINSTASTVALFSMIKWRPKFKYSINRAKSLMTYGWQMTLSALLNTVYNEVRTLIIGLKYSTDDLAYYKRGNQFPSLFINNINSAVTAVMLPTLVQKNDNADTVKSFTRKTMCMSAYIIFPLMVGLAIVAEPLVLTLLTDKWVECIPYLRIACLAYALQPIQAANCQAIKAMGRSDIYLKMEIVKKIVGIFLLIVAMPFGVNAIAWSFVWAVFLSTLVSIYPNIKLINYTLKEQIIDLVPSFTFCIIMAIITVPIGLIEMPEVLCLVIQITIGCLVYFMLSRFLGIKEYKYIHSLLMKLVKKKQ